MRESLDPGQGRSVCLGLSFPAVFCDVFQHTHPVRVYVYLYPGMFMFSME